MKQNNEGNKILFWVLATTLVVSIIFFVVAVSNYLMYK